MRKHFISNYFQKLRQYSEKIVFETFKNKTVFILTELIKCYLSKSI